MIQQCGHLTRIAWLRELDGWHAACRCTLDGRHREPAASWPDVLGRMMTLPYET